MTPSIQCNTSILNRNIPDDDDMSENSHQQQQVDMLTNVEIPTTRLQTTAKKQVMPRPPANPSGGHQRRHQMVAGHHQPKSLE